MHVKAAEWPTSKMFTASCSDEAVTSGGAEVGECVSELVCVCVCVCVRIRRKLWRSQVLAQKLAMIYFLE